MDLRTWLEEYLFSCLKYAAWARVAPGCLTVTILALWAVGNELDDRTNTLPL